MPALVPLVVAIPFFFIGWVVHRVLEHRAQMRKLQLMEQQQPTLPPAALAPDERQALEQRIANLEAIVCSEEYNFQRELTERGAA